MFNSEFFYTKKSHYIMENIIYKKTIFSQKKIILKKIESFFFLKIHFKVNNIIYKKTSNFIKSCGNFNMHFLTIQMKNKLLPDIFLVKNSIKVATLKFNVIPRHRRIYELEKTYFYF